MDMRNAKWGRRLARGRFLALPFAALALFALGAAPSQAGQVITKEARDWASAALKEEKAARPAAGRNTVAVLYFGNRTGVPGNDPLRKGMALMLITDLSTVKELQVVERVRLQALVEEMGLGVSGLVEEGTEPRVGRLLGAQWIVGGDLAGGRPLRAQSRILDVPKSEIVGQPESAGDMAELFRIEKDLLFGILSRLKIELSPEQERRLRKPCSTKNDALFALFRAVEESDRGNYAKSAEYYGQALKEDPDVCLAEDGLDELRTLKLIAPARARSAETLRTLRGETSLTDQLTPKEPVRRALPPKDLPTPANVDVIFP